MCQLAHWTDSISALTGIERVRDIKKPYLAFLSCLVREGIMLRTDLRQLRPSCAEGAHACCAGSDRQPENQSLFETPTLWQ